MRCIFCKLSSSGSKSKEHIVPESLGNTAHILPPGWVCDSCNNYLARKVEAPFLDSCYGKNSRFEMKVQNKKGVYPPAQGMHFPSGTEIEMRIADDTTFAIAASSAGDEARFIKSKLDHAHGELVFLAPILPPDTYETSRFIAKIGLEILAKRGLKYPHWNSEIVEKKELDEIRRYVREGVPRSKWPIAIRRIYPADYRFSDSVDPVYQVLHEFDLLFIESPNSSDFEIYAVIAIFGVEYVINLGEPEIIGYEKWLMNNSGKSYLYSQ